MAIFETYRPPTPRIAGPRSYRKTRARRVAPEIAGISDDRRVVMPHDDPTPTLVGPAPRTPHPPTLERIDPQDKPAILGAMQQRSAVAQYNHFFTGRPGLAGMLRYELTISLLQGLPGALGYALRGKLYRGLLGRGGRGLKWGLGVALRHPGKMHLGAGTAIDDQTLLCARGAPDLPEPSFSIGAGSLIGRFTVVQAKRGTLHIGQRAQIGTHCQIQSSNGIQIGDHFITGPQCYLGGSRHGIALGSPDQPAPPILDQPTYSRGPLTIGHDVWLGAGVRIMEGVTVGRGAVVGSGAVVTRDVPDFAVVAGVPAKIVGYRGAGQEVQPHPPAAPAASPGPAPSSPPISPPAPVEDAA